MDNRALRRGNALLADFGQAHLDIKKLGQRAHRVAEAAAPAEHVSMPVSQPGRIGYFGEAFQLVADSLLVAHATLSLPLPR